MGTTELDLSGVPVDRRQQFGAAFSGLEFR
jgi:hypothetical protein